MSNFRGLKYAIAAIVCIAAFAMLLMVTAQPAAAAPLAGEIFIDVDGDRTYNASVDLGLFTTIQYAIDNASSGDVVVVGSGNYSETLVINVDISLVGANEGIDPNTGVRGNETCLIPNSYGMGPLVTLGSNFVTIDGFCINGSNPALGSFGTANGVNLTMAWGIFNYGGENNFTFVNNIVSTFDTAIMLSGESRDNLIGNNSFDNIILATTGGFAVQLVSDYYADVTNNVFTRTNIAIYASTYATPGSSLIDGNYMSVYRDGIFLDRFNSLATTWTVNNNAIEAIAGANVGIWVQGVEGEIRVDLTFNAISGMDVGIMLVDNPTTNGVNIYGGLIIDCNYAIYAQEGAIAFAIGDSVYTVDGVLIVNPTSYGIYINNPNSLGSTVTRLNIQNGSIVLGGANGIGLEGSGAMAYFFSSDPIEFLGITDQYIRLVDSPRNIDARQVLFDGLTGAGMTLEQDFATENKILHALDQSGLGRVTWVTAQMFVTQLSGSIQRAIDVAEGGDTINVQAGTYAEILSVSASVSLLGPNAGIDPNTGVRGPEANMIPDSVAVGPQVTIAANGVTIDGFSINGSNPMLGRLGVINGVNLTMGWGIFNLGGENNLTIVNNILSTFDTAIALSGESRNNLIGNNLFDNIDVVIGNGFAVQLNADFFADVVKNVFTRTHTAIFASDYTVLGSALIDGNTMSVSWDGIVLSHFAPEVGAWTISNNVVEAIGSNAGITLQGLASSVVLTGDAVSAMQYGILLIDNPASAGISISNELLIDCDYGIYAQEGSIAFIDGASSYLVNAVLIVNSGIYAIYVNDTNSISDVATIMMIQNETIVLGGFIGIGVEGTGAVVAFDGVDPIELTGITDQYISLINSPRDINATQILFDGLIGADMTLEQNFAVEDKVTHALDVSGLGFVQWTADNAYVTVTSGSIQRGIDVGMLNVDVMAGSFEEALVITNPSINLLGAGRGLSNVTAPDLGSPYWLVTIDESNAFVQGFSFSGPATNLSGGVLLVNTASATFVDDDFVSLRDAASSQSVWAMQVGNATSSACLDVSGGVFSDFAGGAIKIVDAPLGFNIFNSDITGSGTAIGDMYGQVGIKVQSASGGLIDTIRFTNFAGSGFGACIEIDAASSGLSVMNSSFIGRGELVDNSAGIRMMGFGPVDVTLGANNFSLWNLAVVIDGSEHLTLVDNIFVDNLGAALVLHESNDTTILRGSFTSNQNGIVAQTGTANDTARDVNFEGNGIALFNQATDVFDARLNWWGHVTGPSGDAQGLGDQIVMSFDDNILYRPWLGVPFPPEVPVNGTSDVLSETHPVAFVGDGLTVALSMIGAGDHSVGLLQYMANPNGAIYWKDANVYFDLLILDITGITQVEMRAYYDPLNLPGGIIESELRAYWSEEGVWKACSDSGVNLTDHYVWVLLRADTSPSLAQLTETPFLLGTPVASFAPTTGSIGSLLGALNGVGFNGNDMVTLYLEDTPIAQALTDVSGNFSFVRGFIPDALPGVYDIRVQDASGFVVYGQFEVVDTTPIEVTLDVGSLYFPGESVTWYVLFAMNGQMLDPDTIVATLYGPEALVSDLSANLSHLTTGLWTVSAIIPGSASSGEYTLVVRANISDSNFGATLRTFLISATLMDQYSLIVGIDGNIAEIQTSIGTILVDLSEISANLTAIEGTLATIQTSIGVLQTNISFINATLISVTGTLVTIQTTLGDIIVQLDEIYTEIEGIQGDIAIVNTTLGLVQVTVEAIHAVVIEINGTVATIQTDLGTLTENVALIDAQVKSINGTLINVQTTLGMVLVNVTTINARVTSIENTLVTITTDIGTLQTSVTNVNAHLTAVQNDVATVQTTVGTIVVKLTALNTTVTSIQGNVATIQTSLGTLRGNVTGIEGNIATIQTNLGTMQTDITGLQVSMVDNGNIGLMAIVLVIMVLFILVAMYFWRLRKVL